VDGLREEIVVELKAMVRMAAAKMVREIDARHQASPASPLDSDPDFVQHRTTDERRCWRELKRQVGFRQARRLRQVERREEA